MLYIKLVQNNESIQQFLEIFLDVSLGKMPGPIPVMVTSVEEPGGSKLFAFEFFS